MYPIKKKRRYHGCKITCVTDGTYINLLYINTAKKHDLTILKEKIEDFAKRLKGETVIGDKGYVSKEFSKKMKKRGVTFIAIKRKNMIKSDKEREYYRSLSKLRKKIETLFSVVDNFGLRFIRAVSRRGLAVKIILSLSVSISIS
ncbi:transposase [Methanothermococcus sp. SCGC AD-155-C09]|nr:transposase [Methanothermococcus sp. SCGC AD-155-C09]